MDSLASAVAEQNIANMNKADQTLDTHQSWHNLVTKPVVSAVQ